jgi:hypothetical protein
MEPDEIPDPDDPDVKRVTHLIDMFAKKMTDLSAKYVDRIGASNVAYGYTSHVMMMLLNSGMPPDEALRYMKEMVLNAMEYHAKVLREESETPPGEKSDSIH